MKRTRRCTTFYLILLNCLLPQLDKPIFRSNNDSVLSGKAYCSKLTSSGGVSAIAPRVRRVRRRRRRRVRTGNAYGRKKIDIYPIITWYFTNYETFIIFATVLSSVSKRAPFGHVGRCPKNKRMRLASIRYRPSDILIINRIWRLSNDLFIVNWNTMKKFVQSDCFRQLAAVGDGTSGRNGWLLYWI